MAEGRKWIPGSAIASDALYSRICREWNSAQNGEIHEIAMKELQDMSAFIAESRFSNVPGMGTEDVASEAVLFMFRKGVQCYIENEALHSAPPALRLAYVRKQLTNAMISAIRTNRCRVSYIVKENSGKKRAYPDSLDRELCEDVTVGSAIPSAQKEWLQREEERIDAEERRSGLHRMLTDFFLQNIKVEKQLVCACCWLLKSDPDRIVGNGEFNIWLANRLNGMSLGQVSDVVRAALRAYDVPENVMEPVERRLMQERDGVCAGSRELCITPSQIAHWVNERKASLIKWNNRWGVFQLLDAPRPIAA